jgi:hypothetical protein
MSATRQDFDVAASAARAAGINAQQDLARDIAREFISDPACFDPKRLIALKRDGVLMLLHALDAPEAKGLLAVPGPQRAERSISAPTDWAQLRRAEPHDWARSVGVGAVIGIAIIIVGLASSMLLG